MQVDAARNDFCEYFFQEAQTLPATVKQHPKQKAR